MALPIILAFIARMSLKHTAKKAIKMAVDKFGKSAVSKTTKKVAKSKPVKHKTELQRVKEQIARDLKKPKVKPTKGKIVGRVRQNYGKWKPVYRKHPKKPTKPKKP